MISLCKKIICDKNFFENIKNFTHTIRVLTQKTQSEAFNKNQGANDTIDIMIMDHVTK